LSVYYSLASTATDGADYDALPGTPVTIADGVSSLDVVVTPIDDADTEGNDTDEEDESEEDLLEFLFD